MQVNRKLYSIKQLFFLSTSVKLQFSRHFACHILTTVRHFVFIIQRQSFRSFTNAIMRASIVCSNSTLLIVRFKTQIVIYDGLSSLQYRIFMKILTFFYNLKQHNSPANLYSMLATQRREVCYNLRNPIQLVKPISSNKHTNLQIKNVFINWCNVTRIYDFNISFTEF